MIPTVLPARSAGERRCSEASAISPPSGRCTSAITACASPAGGDQASDVAAVREPELGAVSVDQLQRVGRRARRHHAQVDPLLAVVPGSQRAVYTGVDGVRDEVEDQRRLPQVRRAGSGGGGGCCCGGGGGGGGGGAPAPRQRHDGQARGNDERKQLGQAVPAGTIWGHGDRCDLPPGGAEEKAA